MAVGATLAAARVTAGLSVAQVSAVTRIRPGLLEAIERDDLAACGGEVYARGHLRAVAAAVGLDPAAVLDLHDAAPPPVAAPDPTRVLARSRGRRWRGLVGPRRG